jgi:hypothetical protein
MSANKADAPRCLPFIRFLRCIDHPSDAVMIACQQKVDERHTTAGATCCDPSLLAIEELPQ